MTIPIIEQAAEKVGGIVALAKALGIKHNAMYSWQQVPPNRVLKIEELTGISRHVMRPDIYGPAPK